MTLRTSIKRVLESAVVNGGPSALSRRIYVDRTLILAYHNVVPAGCEPCGDRSLHLPQYAFADQLDTLRRTHDIVPLAHALAFNANDAARSTGRPAAVITFDDAYSGALTAGVAELRARDLPATIFATPAFLDREPFWWDALAEPASGLDPKLRSRALWDGCGTYAGAISVSAAFGVKPQDLPTHARGASIVELNAGLEHDRLTIAAHTWTHPNLTALSNEALADELARPLQWLSQFGDRALPMVSYPYGLADLRVQRATEAAGYSAGFMIDGGWSPARPTDHFAIPRLNVPAGLSHNGFVARTSGVLKG